MGLSSISGLSGLSGMAGAAAAAASPVVFSYSPGDAITGTGTRSSSATYRNSSNALATAATDVMRGAHYEYHPVTGALIQTLLIEPASTEVCLQSEAFGTTWATTSASITSNATTAPDGNSTADKLVEASATAAHFVGQTFTFSGGTYYTFSCFVKAAERAKVRFSFSTSPIFPSAERAVTFDLTTGTLVGSDVNTLGLIEPWGNGWFRCFLIARSSTGGSGVAAITLKTNDDTAAQSYAGNGTSGLYVWGGNLRSGVDLTSYIPTTTVTVTRGADALSFTQGTAAANLVQYAPYWDVNLRGWLSDELSISNGASYPTQPTNGRAYASIKAVTSGTADTSDPFLAGSPMFTVGPTTARIHVAASRACTVTIEYSTNSDLSSSTVSSGVAVTSTTDYTCKVDVTGLSANTLYYWRVKLDGVAMATSNYRTLTTAPSGAATFNFAFGSCLSQEIGLDASGLDSLFPAVPSDTAFLLHLGDTVYADQGQSGTATTLAQFREKHRKALRANNPMVANFCTLLRTKPVFTMTDDHDFHDNFDDGTSDSDYSPGRQSFLERHGSANPNPYNAGLANSYYYSFSWGDVDFFVLDQRSYRSNDNATDNGSKTILGATQKADLKAWLSASTATFKVIVSPSPAHGYATTTTDSWGGASDTFQVPTGTNGFRTERNEIFSYIDTNHISGVVFISADQHWAGAFKSTVSSRSRYEFMASPFNKDKRTPVSLTADATNGPVFFKYNSANNFFYVTRDTSTSPAALTFQLYSSAGSLGAGLVKTITLTDIDTGL